MPKRNRSKRNKKGGFLGFGEDSSSSGPSWYEKAKGSTSGWFSSSTPAPATPPTGQYPTTQYPTTQYPTGGRRRRRKMRGGYSDNMSTTNLASSAAPFSGSTARAQAYVGGRRTKRRCNTHKKTNKRHCRK
jgi:hypothetical protein